MKQICPHRNSLATPRLTVSPLFLPPQWCSVHTCSMCVSRVSPHVRVLNVCIQNSSRTANVCEWFMRGCLLPMLLGASASYQECVFLCLPAIQPCWVCDFVKWAALAAFLCEVSSVKSTGSFPALALEGTISRDYYFEILSQPRDTVHIWYCIHLHLRRYTDLCNAGSENSEIQPNRGEASCSWDVCKRLSDWNYDLERAKTSNFTKTARIQERGSLSTLPCVQPVSRPCCGIQCRSPSKAENRLICDPATPHTDPGPSILCLMWEPRTNTCSLLLCS